MKLDPNALATCGDVELDSRPGVQEATQEMILDYVIQREELPDESALPFSSFLDVAWNDFNEEGTWTNREVIAGALSHWRGQ